MTSDANGLREAVKALASRIKASADAEWTTHSQAADLRDTPVADLHGGIAEALDEIHSDLRKALAASEAAPTAGERECRCQPCPGRGSDGHGMNHCAECCFGTGVEAEEGCPTHWPATPPADDASEAVADPDTGIVYFPDDPTPNPHAARTDASEVEA